MLRIPKVVLLIESSRASGRGMLCGIANYAHHHGPWSFFWEPSGLEKVGTDIGAIDADGIILRDTENVEAVVACGLPAVVVGHRQTEIPGLVNVLTDSKAVARMAAEHLLDCGFKHFAFCGFRKTPDENTNWSERRRQFFIERIQEAGFDAPPHYELSLAPLDWTNERLALSRWLSSLPKPLGVMACNDDCSQRIMEACKVAGLPVPDLVGVIGADNDEVICGLTNPPMSSVEINFEKAGYEAAHALDGLMRHCKEVPRRITAEASRVVARRSTDFVAADEPHLARALKFIRDHAREGVSVGDVALAAGLSRRALEKRFSQLLGRTILEEIRRVRTDQIARLLLETDLPVGQIADLLGFGDVQHVARYFRSDKRVNPMAYRQAKSVRMVRN